MSKRHMQEGQEEKGNRVVSKSRLARNLVALVLAMSPRNQIRILFLNARSHPRHIVKVRASKARGDPMRWLLSTKDARRSQERKRTNKHGRDQLRQVLKIMASQENCDAFFLDSKTSLEFKVKVLRDFRRKFRVRPEYFCIPACGLQCTYMRIEVKPNVSFGTGISKRSNKYSPPKN